MNILSIINPRALCLAIVCLVVGMTSSAHAVPASQVLRRVDRQQIFGSCCFNWTETVSVVEPSAVVPVVVTWSTDFHLESQIIIGVGLIVNGGPCQFFGAPHLEEPLTEASIDDSRTLQFVVEPAQGLHVGNNTFTLCGGSLTSNSDSIIIGFNTLEVRLK